MTRKQFDLLIFIGRFQPFHNGHKHIIDTALQKADKVSVLVGSSYQHRNTRNPFLFHERKEMISYVYGEQMADDQLIVSPLRDYPYSNSTWLAEAQKEINLVSSGFKKIGLIGYAKDHTSFYLKMFPQYESVSVEPVLNSFDQVMNATCIRDLYFNSEFDFDYWIDTISSTVPKSVIEWLRDWREKPEYKQICDEFSAVREYHKMWESAPFSPTFNTVDSVVIQAGHILLIKRGDYPGKGLWALPGGFINQYEELEDAAIRELREETTIDVPPAVLRKIMTGPFTFASPYRDNRGRTITHAYLFDLDGEIDRKASGKAPIGMTKVKGADDAVDAQWVPLARIKSESVISDHYHIIMKLLEKKQ
jgi:bifunctional NMN adenylyltransferase/nudix hydrolase